LANDFISIDIYIYYSIALLCLSTTSCPLLQINVATAQAAPEGVQDPSLQVVNATTLRVVWTPPDMPNGIITTYMLTFIGGEHNTDYNTSELSHIVDGKLKPNCTHIPNNPQLLNLFFNKTPDV